MKKIKWMMAVVALTLLATSCIGEDPTVSAASSVEAAAPALDTAADVAVDDGLPADDVGDPAPTKGAVSNATAPVDESVTDAGEGEPTQSMPDDSVPEPEAEPIDEAPVEEAAPVDDGLTVDERAEQSVATLVAADHPFDYEVVGVSDGAKTTLREVVDGDRPVLLWFWAPH